MSNGLKNMMPKGIFAVNNYNLLKKKSQDFKTSINVFVQHLQQINRIYEDYYQAFENNLTDLITYFPNDDSFPRFFKQIVSIFKSLNKQLRNFIEKESNNKKTILHLSDLFMQDYNVLVSNFQQSCRQYMVKEQNLQQTCQAYFKMFKQMISNIQSYKHSFMDVKIIYNKDEKIKRYNECVYTYKNLEEDLIIINKKVEELNKDKATLIEKYQILERQLTNFTSSFATRYIDQLKKFSQSLFQMEKVKLNIMVDRLQQMQKITTQNFMISNINLRYKQHINSQANILQCGYLPCFIFYSDKIKQQAKPLFKKMVIIYFQEITIKIQKRKVLDKKIIEYLQNYLKSLDRNLMDSYRQALLSFDKMRKKVGEVFGSRWISFYKIISSLFQNSIENTGRLMKKVENKIRIIEKSILQQASIFDNFLKEFKLYIQKSISKKIFKKYTLGSQEKSQSLLQQEIITSRQEIDEISSVLRREMTKVNDKIQKSDTGLKQLYASFLGDIKGSIQQFYGFCIGINKDYYREDIYFKNYQLCQDQIVLSVKKEMKFFEEMQFASLIKENNKILFDGEFNKIEGFKKIKKPRELEKNFKEDAQIVNFQKLRETEVKSISESPENGNKQQNKMIKSLQKQIFLGESSSKYAQFLSNRIQFQPNQKFIKSCTCALSDKIILAGRMFITTSRLFFYSKFNGNNIFFGETFIEVPKHDIKKIQKKTSSLFINNAISITTVNGELFFISFLNRDKFFHILKNTFQVNSEDIFFEQEVDETGQKQQQLQFEDDMKNETIQTRQASIMKNLSEFKYIHIYSSEFQLIGLNPIKFMKLFQLDQQININRTSYSSFSYYLKDIAEHKEINIECWNPNPLDYLNTINIKEITPQIFTRKISAIVPLPNSGIPFMPKTSLTSEDQTLYIISKDKYIMESIVKSSGVPYSDTFDIRMRKKVESSGQNRVKIQIEMFINFNQSVIVKSTIQNKSFETTKQNFQKSGVQIKSYLRSLQKKLMKNSNKLNPEEKISQQLQLIQQLQNQLKNLKDEKKMTLRIIQEQTIKIQYGKIGLILLGVLVLLELFLLIQ